VTAERVGRGAGLSASQTRRVMAPILRQTLKNYQEKGAAAAFSGPIKRGDINTVLRHLKELKRVPGASEVYRALVKSALWTCRRRRGKNDAAFAKTLNTEEGVSRRRKVRN